MILYTRLPTQNSLLFNFDLSYLNFVRGLSFIDLLILASRLTMLNASYSVKQIIIQCFDQECIKYQKKGKGVFSLVFMDPSSPRLASGSPGLPNNFIIKEPELTTLGLSFSSPGRATARLGELQLP